MVFTSNQPVKSYVTDVNGPKGLSSTAYIPHESKYPSEFGLSMEKMSSIHSPIRKMTRKPR